MGGTGPGTQQAPHKYLTNGTRETACLPGTAATDVAMPGAGQACREDHLAAWGACLGAAGTRRGAEPWRPLCHAGQRPRTLAACFLP